MSITWVAQIKVQFSQACSPRCAPGTQGECKLFALAKPKARGATQLHLHPAANSFDTSEWLGGGGGIYTGDSQFFGFGMLFGALGLALLASHF